jgi:hypothetical protein
MSDHPLGADSYNPDASPTEVPDLGVPGNGNGVKAHTSIVNEVLDLDEFLAQDVRLAQKQGAWYTRPDLEAQIEQLNAELDSITDSNGRPLQTTDSSMEDSRSAATVAMELVEVQKEYAASRRYILMQQLDQDDWDAFQTQWKDEISKQPPTPRVPEFYADLLSKCAVSPKIPADKVAELRKRLGAPAFEEIWRAAWNVNTQSGVSIPKSFLSSAVQRQAQLG